MFLVPRAATTSDAFNAVAELRRREILSYLALQEHPVGDIATSLGLEQPSVSKHLRVLREASLVTERRDGARRYYRPNPEGLAELREYVESLWDDALAAYAAADPARQKKGRNR